MIYYSDCVVGCFVERTTSRSLSTCFARTPGTAKQPEMAFHFESDWEFWRIRERYVSRASVHMTDATVPPRCVGERVVGRSYWTGNREYVRIVQSD